MLRELKEECYISHIYENEFTNIRYGCLYNTRSIVRNKKVKSGCWTRKIAEMLVCVRLFLNMNLYKAMEICKPKYLDTSVHSLVLETLFRQREPRFLAVCKRRHFLYFFLTGHKNTEVDKLSV